MNLVMKDQAVLVKETTKKETRNVTSIIFKKFRYNTYAVTISIWNSTISATPLCLKCDIFIYVYNTSY